MISHVGQLIKTEQGIFCLDPTDRFVSGTLLQQGSYGLDELARLLAFVNRESSVLMLGAHIGTLLIPLSRYVRHVTAFEANPKTHELLEINVLLNGCRNITCYNMVANDFFGSIEFVLNTVNSGGSKRLPLVRDEEFFYDNPQVIRAPAIVLDEFLMDKEYEIIFMDIEGSETHAMRGATRLVSRAKVMFSEFTPKHLRLVAGVTVKEFLKLFDEFQTLIIPSKKITVYSEGFYSILNQMYERDEGDAGIIFIRERIHVNFA